MAGLGNGHSLEPARVVHGQIDDGIPDRFTSSRVIFLAGVSGPITSRITAATRLKVTIVVGATVPALSVRNRSSISSTVTPRSSNVMALSESPPAGGEGSPTSARLFGTSGSRIAFRKSSIIGLIGDMRNVWLPTFTSEPFSTSWDKTNRCSVSSGGWICLVPI